MCVLCDMRDDVIGNCTNTILHTFKARLMVKTVLEFVEYPGGYLQLELNNV